MTFKTLNGRLVKVPPSSKRIRWDARSASKFQKRVKEFLKSHWKYDRVFEEFRIPSSKLSLDFYNDTKKIAVEVQGKQHVEFVKFFHGTRGSKFIKQLKHDQLKWDFCTINDITLVEIYEDDVLSAELFKAQGVDL